MKNAFVKIFIYSIKLFSCIITFLLLPLSLIYNVDALLVVTYPFDIACDISIAQFILILLILGLACIFSLLSLLIFKALKDRGIIILLKLINALAIIIISGYLINYFKRWLIITCNISLSSIQIGIILPIIFLFSFILIVIINNYVTLSECQKIINELFKVVSLTVIIGVGLLSFKGIIFIIDNNYRSAFANIYSYKTSDIVKNADDKIEKEDIKNLPNIILVTFDALAAEDMSLYGYYIKTTPNIDALAKDSYVFDTMIANSNWTRPSAASIITGKYPNAVNMFSVNYLTKKMSYNNKNIAYLLRAKGYKTAAVTSNFYTHPLQNNTFRDFDYLPSTILDSSSLPLLERIISLVPLKFHASTTSLAMLCDIFSPLNKIYIIFFPKHKSTPGPPDLTFKFALKFISNTKSPFFLWIHILPPHQPYIPSEKYKNKLIKEELLTNSPDLINHFFAVQGKRYSKNQQFIVDKLRLKYDENIMYADDEFGKFVNSLSTQGIIKNSILIVTSDHGQSFRKGYLGHGGLRLENLYNQFIQIPLIIHMPNQQAGKRIKSNAEHVDLAPTILELLNMDVPKWMEGESLKGAMYYNQITNKPKYWFIRQMPGFVREGRTNAI